MTPLGRPLDNATFTVVTGRCSNLVYRFAVTDKNFSVLLYTFMFYFITFVIPAVEEFRVDRILQ